MSDDRPRLIPQVCARNCLIRIHGLRANPLLSPQIDFPTNYELIHRSRQAGTIRLHDVINADGVLFVTYHTGGYKACLLTEDVQNSASETTV